ncbi:MAG: zf-HC2 domain-containing protein [Planctomycetes bacterium]|nr:zf-HC2 domain-containing protein [Planctomycetota bacterium]
MNQGCAPFEHELSAWIDGELDPSARAAVDAHLHACERCRAEVRELRNVGRALRRWDVHETQHAPTPGFRNRVVARLGGLDAGGTVEPPDTRTWRRAAVFAAAAAGVVGAFVWASSHAAPGTAPDFAALDARLRDVEHATVSRASSGAATDVPPGVGASGHAAPAVTLESIERIGAVPAIVGEPTARESIAPQEAPGGDPWEVRADGMLLRDAIGDYEQFLKERLRLTLEERIARVERREAGGGSTAAAPAPTALAGYLSQADLSATRFAAFERVQVWPIEVQPAPKSARTLLLEQAIDEHVLEIVENAGGAVVAENTDLKGRPVLLVAGDVLRGGRRDRMLREDVLLAPGRRVSLPVVGASAARERTSYRNFTRSRLVAPVDLRALVAMGALGSDVSQHDVDDAINASLTVLGSPFGERSLENLWTNAELQREVSRYADAFKKRLDRPGVVGFAVAIGSNLVGVEICGDADTFKSLRDRLIRSHVLYALSRPDDAVAGVTPPESEVRALLIAAGKAIYDEPPTAGDGTLAVFRSIDGRMFGCGLLDGPRVVHATVFAGVPAGGAADVASGRRGLRRGPEPIHPAPRDPGSAPDRSGPASPGGVDVR